MDKRELPKLSGVDNIQTQTITSLLDKQERELVNILEQLQKVVAMDKTHLDKENHKGSYNLGIINFVESCGLDAELFVKDYIKSLHPFMINIDKDRSDKTFKCVIDMAYRLPLWIEIEFFQNHEQIISFHELNWYEKDYEKFYSKGENIIVKPLYIDCKIGDSATFEVAIQKGMSKFNVSVPGVRVSDKYARVNATLYEREVLRVLNDMVQDLFSSNGQLANSFFRKTYQASFTSYGQRLQNEVSMLLDLYASERTPEVDIILAAKIKEMKLLPDYNIISAELIRKYKDYRVRGISNIDFAGIL